MSPDYTMTPTWLDMSDKTYAITQPLKPAGYWVLYPQGALHTQFAMYHKPTDEQIKNTEQLLGWGWRDA
ncbi:MAG: hypothetical protein ACOYL0_14125 [Limnohabitans sp.]